MRQPKLYEYKGKMHSMKEWADIKNIKPATLKRRLQYGWSIEESLEKPLCRVHHSKNYLLTYKGETKELWTWCTLLNMPYNALYKRMKSGWEVEDILTKPIRKKRSNYNLCDMDCFNCRFDDCIKR